MPNNSFGNHFRITTWGESHGKAIGVVIDGCPAGLELCEEEINRELQKRSPGGNSYVSPRKEEDRAEIYSGVFEGKTTGAPISIIIFNQDSQSQHYEAIKSLLRPGHANWAYLQKYGIFDYRGGGRASARETACRVAAGAVAKKLLQFWDIHPIAYLKEVGGIEADVQHEHLNPSLIIPPFYCPDKSAEEAIKLRLQEVMDKGDSLGGVVEVCVNRMPVGLGDPIYEKLEGNLAKAFMSLPATKGFEIGSGFEAARMLGSEHNDPFILENGDVKMATNHAGGVLAGISTGMPLVARVCFKPASSIKIPQKTVDFEGNSTVFQLPEGSRHDPCVALRAVPVVEAMTALVLVDACLANQKARIPHPAGVSKSSNEHFLTI